MSPGDSETTPLLSPAAGVKGGLNNSEEKWDESQELTNFDQVLEHIGSYGRWQKINVALLWLPAVAAGVMVLLWSFTGLEPK